MNRSPSRRPTESELILGAREGDEEALRTLLETHLPRVRRVAWRMLGSADDADDCMQEVSIRFHRSLPTFRHDASVGTWCYRSALNWCYDRLRRRSRRGPHSGLDAIDLLPDHGPSPFDHAVARDRREVVEALVRELPRSWQEVVALRYAAGLGIAEIAEVLDCPQGTVASRLYRSIDRVGRALERLGLTEEAL